MAILIVDDEASTRGSLRELLGALGHKTVLEAKNGQEALRFIESDKNRLKMIISDWEMPYLDGIELLAQISTKKDLRAIPFVLITSDLAPAKIEELYKKFDCLDGHLVKPFQKSALSKVMISAHQHNRSFRSQVLCLGRSDENYEEVKGFYKDQPQRLGHSVVFVEETQKAAEILSLADSGYGALLIHPSFCKESLNEILTLKKSAAGANLQIGCISRTPSEIAGVEELRMCCNFFADTPLTLLKMMNEQRDNEWEVDLLFQKARAHVQNKQYDLAHKSLDALLKLDKYNLDAYLLQFEVYDQKDQKEKAQLAAENALNINPFSPKAHIKLMAFHGRFGDTDSRNKCAENALLHCPRSPEVVFAAAQLMQRLDLAKRVLALAPGHKGALELVEKLK